MKLGELSAVFSRGETVTVKSRFFELNNVKLIPQPIQRPHPPIWVGGFTLPALRRAARYGDGFTVPGANCEVYDKYVSELERLGKATEGVRFAGGFQWLIVSNDPEKTWSEAADYIIYQAGQLPGVGRKGRPVAQPSKPARPRAPTSEWPPQGRRT